VSNFGSGTYGVGPYGASSGSGIPDGAYSAGLYGVSNYGVSSLLPFTPFAYGSGLYGAGKYGTSGTLVPLPMPPNITKNLLWYIRWTLRLKRR
jgi:hypothetical protein